MIDGKDISVVVQGPVLGEPWLTKDRRLTHRALARVREILPDAKIILSTWDGTSVMDLDFDEVVFSADPGPSTLNLEQGRVTAWHNVNRQIVSTRAGLAKVTGQFALKMRSDLFIDDVGFLSFFGKFPARDPEFTFLRERVLVSAFHSRLGPNRTGYHPCLFHPNDWFYFGRTADVLDIWDLPLMSEEDARYFERRPKPRGGRDHEGHVSRYVSECYLWSAFVRKHRALAFESYLDDAPELCEISERTIAGNLILLDPGQLQFTSLKYPAYAWLKGWRNFRGRYSHRLWAELYRRYADPAVRLPKGPTWPFVRRLIAGLLREVPRASLRVLKDFARAGLPLDQA